MNKLIVILLISLSVLSCDLAVTTEEYNSDVDLPDVELKDVNALTDVVVSDVVPADTASEDVIVGNCETDRDCTSDKPFCLNNVCVKCRTDKDCGANEICNDKKECEFAEKACQKNSDCDLGFICRDNKCVEGCITDKDCPPASKPDNKFCNTKLENPLCVECLEDKDCVNSGLGTKCDSSGICIKITCDPPCNAWEHCTNDAKCELNDGACNTDKDCQLIDPSNICNMKTHTCEFKPQCVEDKDCNTLCPQCGGYCRSQRCECIINCPKKGLCEQCTDTIECEQGLECRGLINKYCQPPSCQTQQDCGGKYCVMGYCSCGI
ncbi:MAG: hypothetical protein ACP5QK_09920 [Myxococcota bacterium]